MKLTECGAVLLTGELAETWSTAMGLLNFFGKRAEPPAEQTYAVRLTRHRTGSTIVVEIIATSFKEAEEFAKQQLSTWDVVAVWTESTSG